MNNPTNQTPLEEMEVGDLVNLDLGSTGHFEVLKVDGGWIYTRMFITDNAPTHIAPVFVPQPLFPRG